MKKISCIPMLILTISMNAKADGTKGTGYDVGNGEMTPMVSETSDFYSSLSQHQMDTIQSGEGVLDGLCYYEDGLSLDSEGGLEGQCQESELE